MANNVFSVAGVAIGGGGGFELKLKGADGAEKNFEVAIADIPHLVQSLTAIAWASAAENRPVPGTKLPAVNAFPVKHCEVGHIQGSNDPVLQIEFYGGVKLGMHFTIAAAQAAGLGLTKVASYVGPKN